METILECGLIFFGVIFFVTICLHVKDKTAREEEAEREERSRTVSFYLREKETDRTLCIGYGRWTGEAMVNAMQKAVSRLSASSKEETVYKILESMTDAFSINDFRLSNAEVQSCKQCISFARSLLDAKVKQRVDAARAKVNLQKEKEAKEKEMTERQRYILEQRSLVTASVRYNVLRRDGFRCVLCGATAKDGVLLHVDHIIPLARGGTSDPSNLRTLCDRCNIGKGAKME